MKIAQIAPIWYSIPPQNNIGGAEIVIRDITDQLVKNGNEVTLFATENSQTLAQLISFLPEGIGENGLPTEREFFLLPLVHYLNSLDRLEKEKFDIIHCHFSTLADYVLLSYIRKLKNCIVTSHQVFPQRDTNYSRWRAFQEFKKIPFVTVSHFQRKLDLNYIANVYNGIQINDFAFIENNTDDYMIWISRIAEDKGLKQAIEVSKLVKKRLYFCGGIKRPIDRQYYEESVKLFIDNQMIFEKGEANLAEKNNYFGNAKLFLFPIQWEEPFPLVVLESLAKGTPVVGIAKGSLPESIKDGETGFLVNPSDDDIRGDWIIKKTGIEGLCEAVERIYHMPEEEYKAMRRACRKRIEENFTVEKMVDNYEKVYKTILSQI